MSQACAPVDPALPPRRDQQLVKAGNAEVMAPRTGGDWGNSINVPMARDRMLEYFEREQLPGDVKSTLAAALQGDLHYQSLLFHAMLDTWPKLQKAIAEIARKVSIAPWKVIPFAERGEKPKSRAEKFAKEVEAIIWTMRPRPTHGEHSLEGTLKALVYGYYYGHAVSEVQWEKAGDGTWRPRCTRPVPARYLGYPNDWRIGDDGEDRLMFDPQGSTGARDLEDFPEHRFLIAIHSGHAGHAATAAPLRSLAGYWLAAVYGLKWFLNFTQLYGIPWRHAKVADPKDESTVRKGLQELGAQGYIITRPGCDIDILEAAKGGDSLPQKALIDLADQQCAEFILGQTLTSGTAKNGNRALGEVHENTLDDVVDGVADFVGEVITYQFIPSIVALNWGDSATDLPQFWAKREEVKDEKALAERDEKLGITSGKIPVAESWFRERHNVPAPAKGEVLLVPEPVEPPPVDPNAPPALGPDGKPLPPINKPPIDVPPVGAPPKDGKKPEPGKPVAAADAVRMLIKAGGFRTLDDGRVIYIEKTHSDSPGDRFADTYRQRGSSEKETADKNADREFPDHEREPSSKELQEPGDDNTIDLEQARKDHEQEQLEESMSDFEEVGDFMKGKLPRPEDVPADDPLRAEVQMIWDRFKKETRQKDGKGRKVIQPTNAANYFAPKGTSVKLDSLRETMNEAGFDFQTPADMLQAVYDSLEGRKSWGVHGDRDQLAAADASKGDVADLLAKMTKLVDDGLLDEDALAAAMAAAWIKGAKD